MGKDTEAPLFQTKRRLGGTPSEFSFNYDQQPNQKTQDDYFIIGRSDQKFAPSVAYRNSTRSRRVQSCSPPADQRNRSGSQKADRSHHHHHQQQQHQRSKQDRYIAPPRRFNRSTNKHDEAIQTEEPRRALEREIQRIRSEIEQRKRALQERRRYPSEQQRQRQTEQQQQRPQTAIQRPPAARQSPDRRRLRLGRDNAIDLNSSLNAPRDKKAKQDALRSYAQKPTSYQGQNQLVRPESPQHRISPARLSEYQRAYKTPDVVYVRPRPKPSSEQPPARPKSSLGRIDKSIYDTEYRREYKPFKYVSIEQLRATTVGDRDEKVHYVPLRRPISAYGSRDMLAKQDVRDRALTPQPGDTGPVDRPQTEERSRKKHRSEYDAKFRSYFKSTSQDNDHDEQSPMRRWEKEWAILRQQADEYRQRDRRSHFTRYHLAQLGSKYVSCWDQPSTDRYAENCQKYKALELMPRAGRPSNCLKNIRSDPNLNEASRLRRAMFDSHHIAEIMDPNDCSADEWSSSGSDRSFGHCNGPHGCFRGNPNIGGERLAAVLPLGNSQNYPNRGLDKYVSSEDLLTSDEPVQVTSLEDAEQESEFDPNQWSGRPATSLPNNPKWHHEVGQPRAAGRWLEPAAGAPSYGSLSTRSMMSSASLASATLERAKQRRDLMLDEARSQGWNCLDRTTAMNPHHHHHQMYARPTLEPMQA